MQSDKTLLLPQKKNPKFSNMSMTNGDLGKILRKNNMKGPLN
jgi:hypothetical protein